MTEHDKEYLIKIELPEVKVALMRVSAVVALPSSGATFLKCDAAMVISLLLG